MLVYGDRHEFADAQSHARGINAQLDAVERLEPGLERHSKLVGALVDAGRLLQGIADAAFGVNELDERTDATSALSLFLLELGRAVCRSWDTNFRAAARLPRLTYGSGWPGEVELRVPEGYAFYAVYAEAYAQAARRLKLVAPPRVIGIRSIGTSLAGVAAAAVHAPPPVTVRPFGDPFARKIAIAPALERELLDGDAHFVIVDEGPGQSGSSFGSVADWLQDRGVPLDRIALLPSHDVEPGAAASDERRRWWRSVQKEPADFCDRWPELIAAWSSTLAGDLDEQPKDLSAGAWRQRRYAVEKHWPATVPAWERRKFLVRAGGEPFLVKFAGLGRISSDKLAIARLLHTEGFAPEPIGVVHGFLVERWCEDAAPLAHEDRPLGEIGRYIGTRAKLLPAMSGSGATVGQLLEMARRNVSLELGDEAVRALGRWDARASELERRIVRVRTDNKLDRHEWLRSRDGALIKTDAVDHHQAHDFIGCQDLAWDVAGAIAEFDVDQNCSGELIEAAERSAGRAVDPDLLDFDRIAYPAFRLGQCRLGETTVGDARERARLSARGDCYARQLQLVLQPTSGGTRLESSVG